MTLKERILRIRQVAEDADALVREWANCYQAEIDHAGDIWYGDPQRGQWMTDEVKERFATWAEART